MTMKKLKNKKGMTLMEIMVAILVMVLLVIGIGTGMDAGIEVYHDANFEADCIAMSDMLNTAFTDVLQYADNLKPSGSSFRFTNIEYGFWDVSFHLMNSSGHEASNGMVMLNSGVTNKTTPLINGGAYPDLMVENLSVMYTPRTTEGGTEGVIPQTTGGFFTVTYTISSQKDESKTHNYQLVVRHLNAQ